MKSVITKTNFNFRDIKSKYEGKVRDVYTLSNNNIIVIATDRISAFDVIMPKGITYKGQILNQISTEMLNKTNDIVDNWLISSPDPNISYGKKCKPFKIEMVVRGYLSGHSYRLYKSGLRNICGNIIPEKMNENDQFKEPIVTPTTKAEIGSHDQDISPDEIISNKILDKKMYDKLHFISLELFNRGTEIAKKSGLILVDTKYEFGLDLENNIVLIDEIHTPDSSRYFYLDSYNHLQINKLKQKQLSKEFFREWLMENDFQGKEGQKIPYISKETIDLISSRYIELYEKLMNKKFLKDHNLDINERIKLNMSNFL
ncbi:MAG: phosphoribosylaminoimidazolesuccinocarboxamide synthase [Cryomorphaceae bacterium]|nr:MAG: phosphoribosylaminoimidazolesuccinocarboxamide synthase [Cryomorphaceae bacterium]|tara:strand:+ start:445 stop:1389 length:945 start_codon:yes stop_codon:yes gene_type:complete